MTRLAISIVLLAALRLSAAQAQDVTAPPNHQADAKIIEWGWGTPDPLWVRDHIEEMEQIPFDGLVFTIYANGRHDPSQIENRRAAISHKLFDSEKLSRDDYTESIDALKETKFKRFTDNFLRADTQPGLIDWFDDESYDVIVANMKLIAQMAKDAGMKGLMLDTESYKPQIYDYAAQPLHDQHTLEEYQQQAKRRGQQIMRAMNEAYPDMTIIVTLAYSMNHGDDAKNNEKYGLLPAFLDGLNDVAAPGSILYDGWEYSYDYRTEAQFAEKRKLIRQTTLEWSTVPDKLREHWRCAFGIWIDYGEEPRWHTDDFTKNFFTPAEFTYSLHQALRYTDRYVWIYSHQARWWDGKVPQEYIDALRNAHKEHVDPPPKR